METLEVPVTRYSVFTTHVIPVTATMFGLFRGLRVYACGLTIDWWSGYHNTDHSNESKNEFHIYGVCLAINL